MLTSGSFWNDESYRGDSLLDFALPYKLVGFTPIELVIAGTVASYIWNGYVCAYDSLRCVQRKVIGSMGWHWRQAHSEQQKDKCCSRSSYFHQFLQAVL